LLNLQTMNVPLHHLTKYSQGLIKQATIKQTNNKLQLRFNNLNTLP